jgi:TonB family protein
MRTFTFLLCVLCVAGCSTMKQITDESKPHLLFQRPLPVIPESIKRLSFDLDVVLFILVDGTVDKARIVNGSGDAAWDAQAIESIKQWRFTPARMKDQAINTWYRLHMTVRYAEPRIRNLSEILCTSLEEADSVYKALASGADFGELAMKCSVSPSREMNGAVGEIDINMYPENIREVLKNMAENEYTKPIKYGDLYAIFKIMKK